jgi:hypothetical protein
MSDFLVIADVGKTLTKLLWDNMKTDRQIYPDILASEDDITLSSPEKMAAGNNKKLSFFLYRVIENPHLRNNEMQITDPVKLKPVPLTLDLFYLLAPNTDDSRKDHILLGKVMQIFYDNAIVKGSILQGSLAGTTEQLRVIHYSLPFDELIRLWESFSERSFNLSISYQVTPVRIDSTREIQTKRIIEMETSHYQAVVKSVK